MPLTTFVMYPYQQPVRRKVFISYYHNDDQAYKNWFVENLGHLFINKSVEQGDINTDVSTDYVKRLIQSTDFLADASVVIVLCSPNTKGRKHVDWEIFGGLHQKLNGYSGLMGILLPSIPLTSEGNYFPEHLPSRLADNSATGYASIYTWNWLCSDANRVIEAIESAYAKRTQTSLIRNGRLQMQRNTTGI